MHLLLTQPDNIAYVTLNRPDRLNAISMELPGALRLAIETANEDDNVHVIILSGNGRAFCSGYDLSIAGTFLHYPSH